MARAAELLVQALTAHDVDRVFCVPGESYLAVIDALFDASGIDLVTARHEGGGAFMAVADAKLTGRPGIMLVSRGPGATNASIGVHVAAQDAVPLILFIGQVARADLGREAFQEMDYTDFFGGIAKWVVQVTDADQLAETVRHAFYLASSGTPGPVIVSLPEDMLLDETQVSASAPMAMDSSPPRDDDVAEIAARISLAERPLMIAGGQIGGAAGRAALRAVSQSWHVPVAVSWRHQDLFDNMHPNFAAHLGFNMPPDFRDTLNEADLVLAMGTRLGDVTTQGFTIPTAPKPRQALIHVHNDKAQIGKVFATDLAIVADGTEFLQAMSKIILPAPPAGRAGWIERVHALSADRLVWEDRRADDGVVFGNLVAHLGRTLEEDAIISLDAGNFSTWVHRLFPFRASNLMLGALAGSMGFGVPAAVAAGLRDAGRQIVCFVGDGGFQMTGNEISVAVERELPIRIFVSNNGSLGTIRLYQEKDYPGRVMATDLNKGNPDFTKIAQAYGATGLRIEKDTDIEPVVSQALGVRGPAVIEVMTSLEYISAYARMSELSPGR